MYITLCVYVFYIISLYQLVAIEDVEKEISFCKTLNIQIKGVIENMSGYICPHCAECSNVFSSGGGEQLAKSHELKFLGKLPICPKVARLLEGKSEEGLNDLNLIENYKNTELFPHFEQISKYLTNNK